MWKSPTCCNFLGVSSTCYGEVDNKLLPASSRHRGEVMGNCVQWNLGLTCVSIVIATVVDFPQVLHILWRWGQHAGRGPGTSTNLKYKLVHFVEPKLFINMIKRLQLFA